MKKLILVLILILSLSACGWEIEIRNPNDNTSESTDSLSSESSGESSVSESEPESESNIESEPESEPEPEREPKPDSDFGIEPATDEEIESFDFSVEAIEDLSIFASWVGEKDFESPNEVFSSYTLWWFGKEIYTEAGEEDALYDDGHFFAVKGELAEKYFKRHFGMDEDDVKDDYNTGEKGMGYKLPVSGGGAPNKFLSTEIKNIEGNRITYSVLLLIKQDENGRTFAITEMTCDIMKDEEKTFLRLVSNEVQETFGEASFEDQAKYLTVQIVQNLGETYISNGIRVTDSKSVFNFICQMQPSITVGYKLERSSPYIGDFYMDGEGYHLPVASMKKVAKEVFGIGNFTISPDDRFFFDEEKDEYVSGLEWGSFGGATATNLTTYVNGDVYTVRFNLCVMENVDGDPEWVVKDRYKMNFRLTEEGYLRFLGFDKA